VIASGEGTARGELGRLALGVPGRHNALNALAAVAVGLELGVPFGTVASTLAGFQGVERRFQRIGHAGGVTVVDDYGHHPTEIAAVVAAARAVGFARLILVFQPHRYSRTAALLDEFGRALALADEVVLTDVYSAGEDPLPGITADAVADAVRHAALESTGVSRPRPRVVRPLEAVPAAVAAMASPGDLVVTLGAGSIGGIAPRILEALSARATGAGGSAGGHP
jgi:UDP-N-acetylmuramate--alanine ligase